MKEDVVADCLKRIGKLDIRICETITGKQWRYKSKAQFKVSETGKPGFFRENTREVVPFNDCFLLTRPLNDLLKRINKAEINNTIKEIHITGGDNNIVFLKGKEIKTSLIDLFMELGFHGIVIENGIKRGEEYATFKIGNLKYTISPQSFFQTNRKLNLTLIEKLKELLGEAKEKSILDIYGGAGNFSLPFHTEAKEIVVIEENPHSCNDGKRNAALNKIKNIKFIKKQFERIKLNKQFHIAILNPPRMGVSKAAMEKILTISPEKIAYISCNPSTFARDMAKMAEKYTLTSVRFIDMFPNTYHCELLGILEIKG